MRIAERGMLEKVYGIDESAYVDEHGDSMENIPFELFFDWWDEFPGGLLCAFRHDEPCAVVGLFPVTEDWANRFLQYTVSEFDLHREIIKRAPFTHWYLSGLSANLRHRGLSIHLPRVLGFALLTWLRLNSRSIGPRNITIVSEGATETGAKLLLESFRFQIQTPAVPIGARPPRFKVKTSLAEVRGILSSHQFFRRCRDLQQELERDGQSEK
jgi:hypothetical protein